jgi:hypothetical protein
VQRVEAGFASSQGERQVLACGPVVTDSRQHRLGPGWCIHPIIWLWHPGLDHHSVEAGALTSAEDDRPVDTTSHSVGSDETHGY